MISRSVRSTILLAVWTLLFVAGPLVQPPTVAQDTNSAAADAIEWLTNQQLDDGGFAGFNGESDPGTTTDIVIALASAGMDVSDVENEGVSPLDFLESSASEYSESPGGAAKLVLALTAAGGDPYDLNGTDLVTQLQNGFDDATGAYSEQLYVHALAMLAIISSGDNLQVGAVEFLLERQIEDGSWAFTGETEPGTGDTNTTSLAMQALVAAGESGEPVQSALDFILNSQLDDGSVVYALETEDPAVGDSNSTALGIQAMISAGVEADDEPVRNATAALLEFQIDSGAFIFQEGMPSENLLSTAQAVPALLRETFPIAPPVAEPDFAETNQAGLVIYYDDDSIDYYLFDLPDDDIDAVELLMLTDLDLETQPFGDLGDAVCSIDDHGCPGSECFCESHSDPAYFWQFYAYDGNQWGAQLQGANQHTVQAGEILGWVWTDGSANLPPVTFDILHEQATTPSDTQGDSDQSISRFAPFLALFMLLVGIIAWTGVRRYQRSQKK